MSKTESATNEAIAKPTAEQTKGRLRRLPMVALAVLGLTGAVASPSRAAVPVPFAATVAGTVTPTGPGTFHLVGAGTSQHLGRTAQAGDVTITNTDPATHQITDVLVETLTAPNGDTLTIRCEQVAEPVSPGVFKGTDRWTVIGGTGRFSGASGSGTGTTVVDLNTGTFTKTMQGSITKGG